METNETQIEAPAIKAALENYFYPDTGYRREVACFWTEATGFITFATLNSGGAVAFEHEVIWINSLSAHSGKPSYPKCAVMIHSHPPGFAQMSSTDRNMLDGWRKALGIPVFFIVVVEDCIHSYLCDKQDGKIVFDDLGIIPHNSLSALDQLLVYVLYGLSKAEVDLDTEQLNEVKESFNKSLQCPLTSLMGQ